MWVIYFMDYLTVIDGALPEPIERSKMGLQRKPCTRTSQEGTRTPGGWMLLMCFYQTLHDTKQKCLKLSNERIVLISTKGNRCDKYDRLLLIKWTSLRWFWKHRERNCQKPRNGKGKWQELLRMLPRAAHPAPRVSWSTCCAPWRAQNNRDNFANHEIEL